VYRSVRVALTAGILATAPAACDDGGMRVLQRDEHDPEFLLAAVVGEIAGSEPSPQTYRDLALAIDALRPLPDRDIEARAERKLVFLALPPLAARSDDPLADQVEALATTVWPTALGVEPHEDEDPSAFLERACGDALARECKYVVPAYRSLVVSELVWRRFKHRAHSAFAACRECDEDPSFERALAAFDEHQTAIGSRRASVGDRIHPRRWPRAADHGRAWPTDAPLLVMLPDGRSQFRDADVAHGGWRDAIAEGRESADVLGVHLLPTADVALLRDILRYAARAGYRDVALAAIAPEYPFERRAYLLAAQQRERAVSVRVRDVDTIQVLVQAMGAVLESADQRVRI
jgi:hypothetical protein